MKLMQILKNRKGFTLMELIVVLIIIAILMAALLPSMIGWINDARESALRVEGRTAFLAMQATVTQAKGTGYWSIPPATPDGPRTAWAATDPTTVNINLDARFRSAIKDAAIYGNTNVDESYGAWNVIWQSAGGTTAGVVQVRLDVSGNVVGVVVVNTNRTGADVDGIGVNGGLLVGEWGASAAP